MTLLVGNDYATSDQGGLIDTGRLYFPATEIGGPSYPLTAYTASVSGNATSLRCTVTNNAVGPTVSFRMGIWDSSRTLLAEGTGSVASSDGVKSVSISSTAIVSGQTYYIGISPNGFMQIANQGAAWNSGYFTHAYGALPSSVGASAEDVVGIGAFALWADGTAGSSPVLGENLASQTFLSMNSLGGFR